MAMPLTTSYFNWETSSFPAMNDPEMSSYCSFFPEEPPPPPPLPDYSYHENFFLLKNNNHPNSTMMFDYCYSFPELTYHPQCHPTPSLPLSNYDDQTFHYPYPNKRQKLSFEDNYYQLPSYHNDNYLCYDGYEDNNYHSYSSSLMPDFDDIIGVPVPPLQLPVVAPPAGDYCEKKYWCGVGGEVKKKAAEVERTVSAQSVAARERRKKIAEKTQELGKMVPGGCKMNTAEMLLAASKYVKYLQAQVSMLQLMNNTSMEDKASTLSDNQDEQLQEMLGSDSVEEKLYLHEKCLVPQHLVTTLTNNSDILTKPSILKDLNQLITVSDTAEKKKQLQ